MMSFEGDARNLMWRGRVVVFLLSKGFLVALGGVVLIETGIDV